MVGRLSLVRDFAEGERKAEAVNIVPPRSRLRRVIEGVILRILPLATRIRLSPIVRPHSPSMGEGLFLLTKFNVCVYRFVRSSNNKLTFRGLLVPVSGGFT